MSDEPLYTPIPEASAPVQQSTLSPKDDEENYSLSDPDAGIYQKITEPGAGGLYDINGKFLGNPAKKNRSVRSRVGWQKSCRSQGDQREERCP